MMGGTGGDGGEGEIHAEGDYDVGNNIFVAVGKNVKDGKSMLSWTLKSFPGRQICLLHVHQPTQFISLMKGQASTSKLRQQAIKACEELERQKMHKLLNQYIVFLDQAGVHAGKVWIDTDNIERGILQIIVKKGVRWLVCGAAADKYYSNTLSGLKSTKAIVVCQQAPVSCSIWFICRGCLIYSRSSSIDSRLAGLVEFASVANNKGETLLHEHAEIKKENGNTDLCLKPPSGSMDNSIVTLKASSLVMDNMGQEDSHLHSPNKSREHLKHLSAVDLPENDIEGKGTTSIQDKLEQAIIDAKQLKQKVFEVSVRRWRADEDALEAKCKAEAMEALYKEEMKRKKEVQELLLRNRKDIETMSNQHDQLLEELQTIRVEMASLQRQLKDSCYAEKELEEKILQAVKLLVCFKEKRDELQMEIDSANRKANGFRQLVKEDRHPTDPRIGSAMGICRGDFFTFSFHDIIEATQNFDPSSRIGEGRYGSVYKGLLRHVKVAIKMLPSCGSQSESDFKHEAELLSRVRHPHIVTLVGIGPESRSLIYEYLQNGSLDDHLSGSKTRLLPWQSRIRIAYEICSALVFLQAAPLCTFHGFLRPTKVLLDANFVSKVGGLGLHRFTVQAEKLPLGHTLCGKGDPDVTYMDPEFIETGEVTVKSDVYSFGILLLHLLTGRRSPGIVRDMGCALETGNINTLVDSSAGDWPLELVIQLCQLALSCCQKNSKDRPDLVTEVWTVIEPIKDLSSFSFSDSTLLGPDSNKGQSRVPSHFVCPILQEVMEDPYIAADGFTYEGDAIKGWLNSGHKTSPMTNLKLEHCDLIPNYALYYAIQEWQKQH